MIGVVESAYVLTSSGLVATMEHFVVVFKVDDVVVVDGNRNPDVGVTTKVAANAARGSNDVTILHLIVVDAVLIKRACSSGLSVVLTLASFIERQQKRRKNNVVSEKVVEIEKRGDG